MLNLAHVKASIVAAGLCHFHSLAITTTNDSVPPLALQRCGEAALRTAKTVSELRMLADRCNKNTGVAFEAVRRINESPLPDPPPLTVKTATEVSQGANGNAVVSHIFFNAGETYPTEAGFMGLDALIRRLNSHKGHVVAVQILGGVDSSEAATELARPIAKGRADSVRRYLLRAGLNPAALVTVAIRLKASGADALTAQSDRMAKVVVVLRDEEKL